MSDAVAGPTSSPDPDPWWRSAVVYQIYPRSFADADGDGIGDLRGVIDHLDHLERLGVDVVWLSPIYPSPQADNGYDISDYDGVDPLFGTLEDVDELVAGLHARGMRLVMDLVVNHTSIAHSWFTASRSSRESPQRDWYWWRPARPGHTPGAPGAEPTNWESFFSGPSWTYDEATGEYYLHLFDPGQPDLNWENPAVRAAVHAMMRRWLDRGVDGFRMDVINLISKNTALPDGVLNGRGLGDGSPHYTAGPRLHEYLQEMHREVFADRPGRLLTVGETPGVTLEEARLFTDPARREVDMVFQFEHVGLDHGPGGKFDPRPLSVPALTENLARWQEGLAEIGWNSLYWCNHDQPRAVSRFGDDGPEHWRASATALATVLHLQRGTPYIYQGEELGMRNTPFADASQLRDIESLNYRRLALLAGADDAVVMAGIRAMGRDNARTPLQWTAAEHAGFTTGTPWIDANPDHAWLNAAAQVDDPTSVFAHYRRLIALRHDLPIVAHGGVHWLLRGDAHAAAYERDLDAEKLVVVANLSGGEHQVTVDAAWAGAELVLANLLDGPAAAVEPDGSLTLRPWEAVVYRRG